MPNRLQGSTSPYLEQHADQPVDWYPWSDEALRAARDSDRPILLSIGYAACHWCHVMAHESFDSTEIARRMNDWFICIKVDREARPDLDRTYQLAHQLLTGRGGGWPLTMFLDPSDLVPFAAGTYFPPTSRDGQLGFDELLERVHAAWLEQRDALRAQNRRVIEALTMLSARSAEGALDQDDPEDRLIGQLEAREDRRHGGFGDAPKFPQAPLLAWLAARAGQDPSAERMLGDALQAAVRNGLQDQIGGGFFRYCVDAAWEIPHYEKMLAENAVLLDCVTDGAVRWGDDALRTAAEHAGAFLLRELALPGGGFATSLDADSAVPDAHRHPGDGIEDDRVAMDEGAFYRWRRGDFEAVLAPEAAELARARFGLDGPPNLPDGAWHPVQARSLDELTTADRDSAATAVALEHARERLLSARRQRPAPARDEQLRAGPNGLAAAALVRAGRRLGRPEWIDAAERALDRVEQALLSLEPPRALLRGERAEHVLVLDDLAALLDAALALVQKRCTIEHLEFADRIASMIEHDYFDRSSGRFSMVPYDQPIVLARPRADRDEALPAGAALAVRGWIELAHLDGELDRLDLARQALGAVWADVGEAPASHVGWLLARRALDRPRPRVILGGPSTTAHDWEQRLLERADVDVVRVQAGEDDLPHALHAAATAEVATAWLCEGSRCHPPFDDLDALLVALDQRQP